MRARIIVMFGGIVLSVCSAALAWEGPTIDQPRRELLRGYTLSGVDASDPESLRVVLLTYVAALDQVNPAQVREQAGPLYRRIQQLSREELAALSAAYQRPEAFKTAVQSLSVAVSARDAVFSEGVRSVQGIVGIPPSESAVLAPYPTGTQYDTIIIDPLDFLGNLTDDGGATAPDSDGELRDERCNANGYATLFSIVESLTLAAQTAAALCELDPTGICSAIAGIAQVAVDIAALDLKACDLHIGNVDSAEIEATYENVLTIFDALQCVQVVAPRKHHGCNGEDDDCDQTIDECDEDSFGPDVHIDPSVKQGWFQSTTDAISAVDCAVHAVDDCQAITVASATLSGTCDSVSASVTATDACGNATTKSVGIKVDDEAPVTTCAVTIDELSPPNHKMIDVGFTFTATDNCGEPAVVVTVRSDEPTASASGAGQTSPAPDAEILKTLDGVVHGVRLRTERSTNGNGRVYEITVTAIDAAGNSHQSSCQVGVPKSDEMGPPADDGQFYDATGVN